MIQTSKSVWVECCIGREGSDPESPSEITALEVSRTGPGTGDITSLEDATLPGSPDPVPATMVYAPCVTPGDGEEVRLGSAGLDASGRFTFASEVFCTVLGANPSGLIGRALVELLPDPDRERADAALQAVLAGGAPTRRIESRRRTDAGELRVVQLTLARVPAPSPTPVMVVAESLTDRHHAAQRLAAQHAVARILADAETIADASPRILQAISESLGWDLGGLWIVERDTNRLRSIEGWAAPGIHAPEFLEATKRMRPARGEALPGYAWQSVAPVWIEDLPKGGPIFVRGPIAAKEGLHGAFAFPIVLGAEVIGVMDFFSREVRRPHSDVLEMLSTFGSQIGQFMERRRIEEALRISERRLQAIVDTTPSHIYVTDLEDRVVLINRRTEQLFGARSEDVVGRRLQELLPPALAQSISAGPSAVELGRLLEREETVMHSDGPHFYLSHRFLLCAPDGRPYAVCGISTDITQTKRAEQELRTLATELSAAEDQARKRLARDIHDSIGQSLSVLKMSLEGSRHLGPPHGQERGGVDLIELVDTLIAQVRSMIFDLYPSMLDDLGLVPTLFSYAEQFRQRTGIRATVTEIGTPTHLDGAATNYLFRALKELLNNVAKHARAKEALIAVHWKRDVIRAAVADDGLGFDPQAALEPHLRRGLGLADLRERLRVMGGQVSIDSSPGRGTHVVLEMPLRAAEPERRRAGGMEQDSVG